METRDIYSAGYVAASGGGSSVGGGSGGSGGKTDEIGGRLMQRVGKPMYKAGCELVHQPTSNLASDFIN